MSEIVLGGTGDRKSTTNEPLEYLVICYLRGGDFGGNWMG